jgi:hypothetical protein
VKCSSQLSVPISSWVLSFRLVPSVPLEVHAVTSFDGNRGRCRFRRFVTCYVRCAIAVRLDKTVVLVQGQPACSGHNLVGGQIEPVLYVGLVLLRPKLTGRAYRVGSWVGLSIDRNPRDVAVGSGSRSKCQRRNGGDDGVLRERGVVHGDDLVIG